MTRAFLAPKRLSQLFWQTSLTKVSNNGRLRCADPPSKSSAAALPPLARPWPIEGVDTHFSGVGMTPSLGIDTKCIIGHKLPLGGSLGQWLAQASPGFLRRTKQMPISQTILHRKPIDREHPKALLEIQCREGLRFQVGTLHLKLVNMQNFFTITGLWRRSFIDELLGILAAEDPHGQTIFEGSVRIQGMNPTAQAMANVVVAQRLGTGDQILDSVEIENQLQPSRLFSNSTSKWGCEISVREACRHRNRGGLPTDDSKSVSCIAV
jgi:hypothetical protein